ncbi:MAG: hypothetical protein H7263_18445 [Candidatus Sericytochromatia bacterium]|nr:hypothetical protein [Candidatus Sericytochromatia bacterium]
MIKQLITALVIFMLSISSYGQAFSNFSNVEDLFTLPKNKVEEILIKEYGYRLKSKDIKSGIITYTKQNSVYNFAVNVKFNGDHLKMIGWDDTINSGQFMVNDIGNNSSYKIDESKTDDSFGVYNLKSQDKNLVVIIFKTLPNTQKGIIAFTLSKIVSNKKRK